MFQTFFIMDSQQSQCLLSTSLLSQSLIWKFSLLWVDKYRRLIWWLFSLDAFTFSSYTEHESKSHFNLFHCLILLCRTDPIETDMRSTRGQPLDVPTWDWYDWAVQENRLITILRFQLKTLVAWIFIVFGFCNMTLGSINIIYEAVTAVPDNSTSCGGAHDSVSHELPLSPISHGLKSTTGTWMNETIGAWFFYFCFPLPRKCSPNFISPPISGQRKVGGLQVKLRSAHFSLERDDRRNFISTTIFNRNQFKLVLTGSRLISML